jgi:hypothetical protein
MHCCCIGEGGCWFKTKREESDIEKGSDVNRASIEVDWGICMIQKTAFLGIE